MSDMPAAPYQPLTHPFANQGIVSKKQVALLEPGQYQQLFNMTSLQEGSLTVVRGTQRKNNANPVAGLIHTIAKLRKSADQALNFRYLGIGEKIFRGAATDSGPFTEIIDLGSEAALVRWMSENYATGVSGNPSKYFATNTQMLKDDGTFSPPETWGIFPPTRPVRVTATTAPTVNTSGTTVTLVGGQQFSPSLAPSGQIIINGTTYDVATWNSPTQLTLQSTAGTQTGVTYSLPVTSDVAPYAWLYVYRNDITGLEGNPCVEMVASNQKVADSSAYTLTLQGTGDPQIDSTASHKTISIFRQGGTFADGLYRFLGYATNPGDGATVTFLDNIPDDALIDARTIEFDNDPPVSSNLKIPLSATINNASATMSGNVFVRITLNQPMLTPAATVVLSDLLGVGSQVTIGQGDTEETVVIEEISTPGDFDIQVWTQLPHQNGDTVTASYKVGQPCRFLCQAFNSMFLAGDPNNPHVLYKSKTARPESWPIVNLENGASGSIVVGSPSNPIQNITEYNGEVVVMNLNSISVVRVWGDQMQAPIETPAKRGLLASFAWCKVGNAIWYLSYDGIYSWEGGQETKRSEAINPMFLGEFVNGIAPMDMSPGDGTPGDPNNALQYVTFEYHNHEVNIIYRDTGGQTRRLRYSIIYNRWYIRDDGPRAEEGGAVAVNAMHLDQDTGNLVIGKFVNASGDTFIEYDDLGSSESWISAENDGGPIALTALTAFYNLGSPAANKHYGDLVPELDNTDAIALTFAAYWDFSSTADPSNTFAIPADTGRRTVALPIVDDAGLATGHDARAMALLITGSTVNPLTLYSLTFNALNLEYQQRGRAYDWDHLGYDYDKLLQEVTVEYDFQQAGGNPVLLALDTKSGILGIAETLNVATWLLTGTGRSKVVLPIPKDTVAKLIRLRPVPLPNQTQSFMIWDYKFQFDKWPADILLATPWDNSGYDYDKYFNQLDLDVDTGGVLCELSVQLDGVTVQTLPKFSTDSGDRHRNFTLKPELRGKQSRIIVTPGEGGKFQLFYHKFIVLPADKGPVTHTYDYDDLGHPFDKRLNTVTFEYDTAGIGPVTMIMDTISGVKGEIISLDVQRFELDSPTRAKPTFPVNLDTIAKMVRFHPADAVTQLKVWKYVFDKVDYPADIIPATQWEDMGYPQEKILRELTLDMDTGGKPCKVIVEIDGTRQYSFHVTTTLNDKSRMITMPSRPDELIGKIFRLIFEPSQGGKAQYFRHSWERVIEPPRVWHFSSLENNAGDNGYKLIKKLWLEYTSYAPIIVSIFTDRRQLFYQKELPTHPYRDVESFLLPAVNNGVLNKSYLYAVDVDSCMTFKLYKDSCRWEIKNMNGDARSAWRQFYMWQEQPLPGI